MLNSFNFEVVPGETSIYLKIEPDIPVAEPPNLVWSMTYFVQVLCRSRQNN